MRLARIQSYSGVSRRPSIGRKPSRRCGACRRPVCRKAGCIRGRNSRRSGGGQSAPLHWGRKVVRRGRGDRVEVQGQIVPEWWRAVLRRIARSVVPERVVVRAERLRTFRGLWVAQDFRARDFDSFPFCSIFLDCRRSLRGLKTCAACLQTSAGDGFGLPLPMAANTMGIKRAVLIVRRGTTKRITIWLAVVC